MQQVHFEKFTLSNGLDVILHQDNALPLVAVNVWYHVGSKDERVMHRATTSRVPSPCR